MMFGAIPSPQDYRDYHVSLLTTTTSNHPDEYMHPFIDTVYNQGGIGSCVPYAGTKYIREAQERLERGAAVRFSVGFDYGYRTPEQYQGEGMIVREYLENRLKVGSIPHEMLPVNDLYYNLRGKIRPAMIEAASKYKIAAYARVYTPDEVKSAIRTLGPVIIVFPVYESFLQGGDLPLPDTSTEQQFAFHAVAVVGWQRDNRWRIINSWGDRWGNGGFGTIPFNYPITETWAVTDKIDPRPAMKMPETLNPLPIKVKVVMEGREIAFPDVPPMIVGIDGKNRTMVPIRALEAAGLKVIWDEASKTILIKRA